ncbi:ATP-binding cassette sub-family C member 10-like [Watersipora subatra]|uniref:ATP-binding cassette sub-family C member 10-like n=1 Tax=Watersipora subatra TaxID=2589382 RepID=UPI00355B3611
MSIINWDDFCGCSPKNDSSSACGFNITIVENGDLSPCFHLLLQAAASLLLFFASLGYLVNFLRYKHDRTSSTSTLHYVTLIRAWASVFVACANLARSIIFVNEITGQNDVGAAIYYITTAVTAVAWLVLAAMFYTARYRFPLYKRGPILVIILYLINVAIFGKTFQWYWMLPKEGDDYRATIVLLFTVAAVANVFLFTALIPSGIEYSNATRSNIQDGEEEETAGLITGTNDVSYRTFSSQRVVPKGEEGNIFSQLIFWWVQPLMKRGKIGLIETAEDVFKLPDSLNTVSLADKFYSNLTAAQDDRERTGKPKRTLMAALHRSFGGQYYALGVLKLLADALGFAGPLLLNALITYMEDPDELAWHGYIYAGGLFLSTFLASLLTAHFDYLVKKIGVKLSSAIISCVYKRMLSVNTVELSHFTTGETVNFMSVDVDRTVNFCASFHQFWSLPFQIVVSLYLLYVQIGWSFLAGLIFAILLIPINRKVAVKIGELSTAMMSQKDQRVKTMNELIFGIRVVKLFSWENFFLDRVNRQRAAELSSLKSRKYLDALCVYFWATTPVLISILTFTTYSLLGNELTAPKVFTSLALFNMLIGPLNSFPWVINGLVEAWVSVQRVQQFVDLKPQLQSDFWVADTEQDGSVKIDNASFSWQPVNADTEGDVKETDTTLRLSDINLDLRQGMLLGVIGAVGSGKTSLLMSMLNEMRLLRADNSAQKVSLGTSAGIGLVTQQAWIKQGTIRENILMGSQMQWMRYNEALECSALADDVKNLPDGDKTEVGENGVTLSGGQRARLTLARAIYQDLDVYFLDDPLAAVDAKVSRHIFDKCIMGYLRGKARILCTHHLSYLWDADRVIVMDEGWIVASGAPADVLPAYTDSIKRKNDSQSSEGEGSSSEEKVANESTNNEEGAGPIVEEEKDRGTVKLHIYRLYAAAVGTMLSFAILVSMVLMQGSKNVTDWWLSYWISNAPSTDSGNTTDSDVSFYLEVYGGLAAGNTLFTLFRAFLFAYGGICAAASIHDQLLSSVTKAPMTFFDTTATGRIINRFSSDVYTVDDSLPFIANILLSQVFSILGTVVITIYGLPWFAAVLVPLTLIYYYIQGYYRHTSRELKRITSATMSEVYAHLSESVEGRVVIRAFNQNDRFEKENLRRVETYQRANFSSTAAAQWLNIRLQGLGVLMVSAIALLAVIEHNYRSVNTGLVGLAISYALSITNLLSGVVSSFTETEKQLVSVERVDQYVEKITAELLDKPEDQDETGDWPSAGKITLTDVCLKYRPELPLVLDNVTVTVEAAEKIGIVGRTGSGKSSLFNVLFRMVDKFEGSVIIDDVDIKDLALTTLRSRIAIIPQSPFLFSGTIRENLDPCQLYSDDEIWQVLEKCHLKAVISSLGGLSLELAERGKIFSIGQSQLVCLARAMLLRSKILCIDEATANVDLKTDSLIQETIREEFKNCTVLTIAHRVSTVLQSDKILVLSRGRVVEFGSPNELLADANSHLSSIVSEQTN